VHIAAQPAKPSPVANGLLKGTAPAISQASVEIAASPAAHPLPGELQCCMRMLRDAALCTELIGLLLLLLACTAPHWFRKEAYHHKLIAHLQRPTSWISCCGRLATAALGCRCTAGPSMLDLLTQSHPGWLCSRVRWASAKCSTLAEDTPYRSSAVQSSTTSSRQYTGQQLRVVLYRSGLRSWREMLQMTPS